MTLTVYGEPMRGKDVAEIGTEDVRRCCGRSGRPSSRPHHVFEAVLSGCSNLPGLGVNGHSRLSRGPVASGAIKLKPDEDVTLCLGIGEGPESSLSLQAVRECRESPVWSLISAGHIER
ncbi:MAG TPA: hypothetical protein VIL09_15465 [Microvirga sp.]|jgi:hypothetical protein